MARSITDPDWQENVLAKVARALVEAGQLEQAKTVARSITNPGRRSGALAAVARGGQREQAETVARSITDPDGQALALAEVAKALLARGDTRQAHHVAATACASGQWTTMLDLVLSLEPSALRVLTDL